MLGQVLSHFNSNHHLANGIIALMLVCSAFVLLIWSITNRNILTEFGKYLLILSIVTWTTVPIVKGFAAESERDKLREEASRLENAIRKTIQSGATQSVTSLTVPGFQSNAPSQSKYYNNEKSLKSQTNIESKTNSIAKSISQSIAKRPIITNKELEQWVILGTRAQDNPHAYAKGYSGSSGNCKSQMSGGSSAATWEYSCDEGVKLSQYTKSCDIPLLASQSTDYIYQCRRRWIQADCTYEPDFNCARLSQNSSCSALKQISGGHCNSIGGICGYSCDDKVFESTCSQKLSGLKPIEVKTSPIRFYWNTSACRAVETDQGCTLRSELCTTKASIKRVGTERIYKDCWGKTRTYACSELGEKANDCRVPENCKKKASVCLSTDSRSGNCRNWEHNYVCKTSSTPPSIGGYCEEDIYCIDGDCVKTKRPQSTEFPTAITSLNLIGEIEEDFDTEKLQVFPGQHAKCDKAIAGLQNCCSNDGLLVKLGANCSHKDHAVARNRRNGLCHQVGTYCSKKTLFGICLKKRKTFCCFNSALAKAIHVQGRKQISKNWGNAKFPDCSGYTVASFQKLDLSKLDLSDFYGEVIADFSGPNSAQVTKAIRERLIRSYKCPPNCPK